MTDKKAQKPTKAKTPAKNKGGRPKKVLTPEEIATIESWAQVGCTWEELANKLGWALSTLQNKEEARDAYKRGSSECKMSVRRAQYQCAMNGNAQMLIWLGKIYLHQKEEQILEDPSKGPALVKIGARS